MSTISNLQSVVVVGEGPAGLATSIVAKLQGHNVILVKKRNGYDREQIIFLKMSALKLLKRINVLGFLKIEIVRLNSSIQALVSISRLEEVMHAVAKKLGVTIIHEQFEKIDNHSIVLSNKQKIPYGILVGADGAHSKVRDELNIKCNTIGFQTLAASAFIPKTNEITHVQEVQTDKFFMRNVHVPSGSFLLMHVKLRNEPPEASKQALVKAALSCGWSSEAKLLQERICVVNQNVAVSLKQAATFCDSAKDVILIGDSTTTGSFYLGRGVNLAFEIVEVAEKFFTMGKDKDAYHWYNHQVKKLSDELVTSNLHLFSRL